MSGYHDDRLRDLALEVQLLHRRLDRLEANIERNTINLDRFRIIVLTIVLVSVGMSIGATISYYN
jgi:hypothetical protein